MWTRKLPPPHTHAKNNPTALDSKVPKMWIISIEGYHCLYLNFSPYPVKLNVFLLLYLLVFISSLENCLGPLTNWLLVDWYFLIRFIKSLYAIEINPMSIVFDANISVFLFILIIIFHYIEFCHKFSHSYISLLWLL